MQPIVDELEIEYQDTVSFVQINASTAEGLELFNAYSLLGHPSYLILEAVESEAAVRSDGPALDRP